MRVLDFFSGCGGTSLGFQQAGMSIAMGLDVDSDATETYRANFQRAETIRADIRDVGAESIAHLVGSQRGPVVFSGCAPCQPFSRQRREHSNDDPRRHLLSEFSRFVAAHLPEYVFVENVPGLQRVDPRDGPLSSFLSTLRSHGYYFDVGVVPALQYGVPQIRERLVVLASRTPGLRIPEATHGPGKEAYATVRDWISGFPALSAGETDPGDRDHAAAGLSVLNLKRIAATPEGGGREHWPKNLWLECHQGHSGHSDVYGRLSWSKPASGLTTRCISYSNGRFGHPVEDRAITVREAGCLQTFPRTYEFRGSLESRARQVGNAVPPLMAKAVGKAILSHWKATGRVAAES